MAWTPLQIGAAAGLGGVALGALGVWLLKPDAKPAALPASAPPSSPVTVTVTDPATTARLASCERRLRDADALLSASAGVIGRLAGAPAGLGERIQNFLALDKSATPAQTLYDTTPAFASANENSSD